MKQILKILLPVLAICLLTEQLHAQTYELQIDSIVGIPDTIPDGGQVTFYMMLSANSPLFYQGNFFVELEYGGQFYQADSTMAANTFIGTNAPNTLQVTHVFTTDNDLSIGDNVVVVWPRIGNGVNPPQEVLNPKTVVITLVEPNGVRELIKERKRIFYPNPASSILYLMDELKIEIKQISIYDALGKHVDTSHGSTPIDVSNLPTGMYFIHAETQSGMLISDKLIVSR